MTRSTSLGLGCVFLQWLLLVLLGAPELCAASSGEGEPLMQHFSPRDYHAGTQCWSLAQDARGVMYVGSLGIVLEYDGSTWRKIPVESDFVAGLAYEVATDRVFVGGANNLGYLEATQENGRVFVSLLSQLPADSREVGSVHGVYVTPEGVYFVGTKQVMRWRNGRFKVWKLATAIRLRCDWTADRLYVYNEDVGLLRLENDAFVSASNDPFFHRAAVRSILAFPDGSLLVGTLQDGLLILRGGTVQPADGECRNFLRDKGVFKLLRLREGSLAVVTDTAGLLVLDPNRRFRMHVDQTGGLHGTNIFDLFEDVEGGLWIGLQSGVTRVEVNSPLSILRAGPDDDMSSAYYAGHWFDKMVLGNALGWYCLVPADPAAASGAHLEKIPGTMPFSGSACEVENGLLTVTNRHITLLDAKGRWTSVDGEATVPLSLCGSRVHPGVVYALDEDGHINTLQLDHRTQRWFVDKLVADLGQKGGGFDLTESPQGDLWVDSKEHGLIRVELNAGGQATIHPLLGQPGPLREVRSVQNCGSWGPLRFKSSHAVCGLDASGRDVRLLPEFGPHFCDGSWNFGDAMSYDAETLWFSATSASDPTGDALRGRAVAGNSQRAPTFQPLPRKIEAAVGGGGVFHPVELPPSPLKTLLLVGDTGNGVVRLDVGAWEMQSAPRPFATLVRRAFTVNGATTIAKRSPILSLPLPFSRNSVHFEFAAGTLAFGAAPRFQTRLIGFGQGEWSEFNEQPSVDYLNLPEGNYRFEVRARNSDGILGSVGAFGFRVLPPWQRTSWAYLLYTLLAGLGVLALIAWRSRQLRQRNLTLAALVDDRTVELRAREADLLANEHHLRRARDDAEAANRAKSAFLANMSHELRTPLNAILGYAQIMIKRSDLPSSVREQVKVIGRSGGHLLSLINEVLDLSKIEAGKFVPNPSDFVLSQLLDEVSAAFRPRFTDKGLTYSEQRLPGLPQVVHTDPGRLRQVLFNLLSNAVKFTMQGSVFLKVKPRENGWIRFEVTDTGVGIAEDQLDRIFLAFHQAGTGSLSAQGTGLGLTISQRLVGLLGGRIEVTSTLGQGSRFWFELPLLPVKALGIQTAQEISGVASGQVISYEGTPRRLLVVDDMLENRLVLREFLQPLGFEVTEAVSGEDCLAACQQQMPDAVLLDLRLGGMDGFEVARILRTHAAGLPLGIVAISASVFESDRQQAMEAGCDDFLPKPFEEAQLLGILSRVLGLRWIRQEFDASAPSNTTTGDMRAVLPASEVDALLELSLRGDIVGLRKALEVLRTSAGATSLVRCLEPLVATYDMDGIHALLLTLQTNATA